MHAYTHYFIYIHIEPVTEETMYEVIVEPQEQPEQAQEENHENTAQAPIDPSANQQPEGKAWCITPNLNYAMCLIK